MGTEETKESPFSRASGAVDARIEWPGPPVRDMNESHRGEVSSEAWEEGTGKEIDQCYRLLTAVRGLLERKAARDPAHSSYH